MSTQPNFLRHISHEYEDIILVYHSTPISRREFDHLVSLTPNPSIKYRTIKTHSIEKSQKCAGNSITTALKADDRNIKKNLLNIDIVNNNIIMTLRRVKLPSNSLKIFFDLIDCLNSVNVGYSLSRSIVFTAHKHFEVLETKIKKFMKDNSEKFKNKFFIKRICNEIRRGKYIIAELMMKTTLKALWLNSMHQEITSLKIVPTLDMVYNYWGRTANIYEHLEMYNMNFSRFKSEMCDRLAHFRFRTIFKVLWIVKEERIGEMFFEILYGMFSERVNRWQGDMAQNLMSAKAICKICGGRVSITYMMAHSKFCLASFEFRNRIQS
jgi:serine/threonine protein kinase